MPEPAIQQPAPSLGAAPISADAPAGVNVAELPEFDALTEALAALDLGGVRAVNWQQVVSLSEALLRDRGKHLKVGVHYAHGLMQTEGSAGLATGLAVLADMVESHWEGLFPPPRRLRGRINVIAWLAERVDASLDMLANHPVKSRGDALAAAERLVSNLGKHNTDAADAAWPLVATLRDAANRPAPDTGTTPKAPSASDTQKPPADSRATGAATGGTTSTGNVAPITPDVADLGSERTREHALKAQRQAIFSFVRRLRDAAPSDPRAYSLHRASVWLQLKDLPPAVGGVTELPCPPAEVQAAIEASMVAEAYEAAVSQCEEAVIHSLFWFQGHRICAQALSRLGRQSAADAVQAAVGALLSRFPGLKDLKFRNGDPFVDAATRSWLGLVAGDGD